jgi:hypothetical protein
MKRPDFGVVLRIDNSFSCVKGLLLTKGVQIPS